MTDLGTARSEDGAHTMIAIAYDSMTPAQRRGVKWRILKE